MSKFTNIEAEKSVLGWLSAEYGFDSIRDIAPDINPMWFEVLRPAYVKAEAIDREGREVTLERICEGLGKEALERMGGASVLAANFSSSVLEDSLLKLRELYGARCVAELGSDMGKGMSPAEAIKLLEPLVIPQGKGKLKKMRFDISNPPPPAIPSLYLAGQGICTAGNLTTLTGGVKAGKSAIIGAILASYLDNKEHLGMRSQGNGKAVVHFDTEQSPHHHHRLVLRAMQRAGLQSPPILLRSYCVIDLSIEERLEELRSELAAANREHGGIDQVIIDGVADLCHDPNDPNEAFALVNDLRRLSVKYQTNILVVLHLNPGTQISKSRGHLGSQLDRKAESVIQLEKDKEGVVTSWLSHCRDGFLPKEKGSRFSWDEDMGMFMPVRGTRRDAKAELGRAELVRIAELVLRNGPRKAEQFKHDIKTLAGVSYSTAERRFKEMKDASVIRQNLMDEWELKSSE